MSRKKMILKLLTVIVGTVIAAFGLDIAIYAGFGSATLAVLWQGMAKTIRITIGQASLIIASAMVAFCWFYDRKQIHIGTILYQVIYSFCIDLFAPFLHYSSSKLANFLIMICGLVIFSFGSALYSLSRLNSMRMSICNNVCGVTVRHSIPLSVNLPELNP